MRCKSTTDHSRLLSVLTSTDSNLHTEAIEYGRAHDREAISRYVAVMAACKSESFLVLPSGFVVLVDEPWFGAMPDGIIDNMQAGIVEVKCPMVCRIMSFSDCASGKVSNFSLKECGEGLRLNTSHQYHHQVQVQLFMTKARFCHFVVWSPTELHIERILPLVLAYRPFV